MEIFKKITIGGLILFGIVSLFLFAVILVNLHSSYAVRQQPQKVTICHATESEVNPYNRIVVSENAIFAHFENPGTPKAGHEQDILLQGEQDCPTTNPDQPTEPEECPEGTYSIGVDEDGENICKAEPTGCPYGDSIPLDSPKCVPPETEEPKPAEPQPQSQSNTNTKIEQTFVGK